MNTSLSHLPEYKQLSEITEIIVKAVDPEQVIRFGSHARGRRVEHRYSRDGITNIRASNRGSQLATIVEIENHPEIKQIQVHPGGGRHEGAYLKISSQTEGIIKVVD